MIGKIKTTFEFLGDFVKAVKDTPWPNAIAEAVPWTEHIGGALAESVAPVKFILELHKKATQETGANELGLVACTTAFQRSVQQAFQRYMTAEEAIPDATLPDAKDSQRQYRFAGFTYRNANNHEFYRDCRAALDLTLKHLKVEEAQRANIMGMIDRRFVPNLQFLLSDGETSERFKPFLTLIQQEDFGRHYTALEQHVDYQRWQFENKPVLGNPFALSDIYVETDCGVLEWGEVERRVRNSSSSSERFDPFIESDETGGRHPLLKTAMDLIKSADFHDAIVVQGHAGAGKSAFTLRLCNELIEHGLKPIRIELKHLDADSRKSIDERLMEAVELGSREYDDEMELFRYEGDLFENNTIFNQTVEIGDAKISRYVLILDAWDEVNVGASLGYQRQMDELLLRIRRWFLDRGQRAFDIRVVLCGRPTDAVGNAGFMHDKTRLLTVRSLHPERFQELVGKTGIALKSKPIPQENWVPWSLAQIEGQVPKILERYKAHFEKKGKDKKLDGATLEILGLPLLAQLALRLLAHWKADVEKVLENTTVLYRSLVDLVIDAGKPPGLTSETIGSAQLRGREHRALLRLTAKAITLVGQEHITHDELEHRLSLDLEDEDFKLEDAVKVDSDNALSTLMISFFFKGGFKELGCEFSHKSFREFLFAEYIIEVLKDFGRGTCDFVEKTQDEYWKDFAPSDPRYDLSRELGFALGPKWISPEVGEHLTNLIEWEALRTFDDDPYPVVGVDDKPLGMTDSLSAMQWERVREGLADLWDWWGEGVHMRPQPRKGQKGIDFDSKTLVARIAEADIWLTRMQRSDSLPRPTRTATIDAHLGDAILQLCADVHRAVAFPIWPPTGDRIPDWTSIQDKQDGDRRYQVKLKKPEVVLFAPSAGHDKYFQWYIGRIESAGFRARGSLPSGRTLAATYLACYLDQVDWDGRPNLSFCRLTQLYGSYLRVANLSTADLSNAELSRANLSQADLSRADLSGAVLSGADLSGADLSGADLSQANLSGADLIRVNLSGATLSGADLSGANLIQANLSGADLSEADLSRADLSGATLSGADLSEADLSRANLSGATLSGADLSEADLSRATLKVSILSATQKKSIGKMPDGEPYDPEKIYD